MELAGGLPAEDRKQLVLRAPRGPVLFCLGRVVRRAASTFSLLVKLTFFSTLAVSYQYDTVSWSIILRGSLKRSQYYTFERCSIIFDPVEG